MYSKIKVAKILLSTTIVLSSFLVLASCGEIKPSTVVQYDSSGKNWGGYVSGQLDIRFDDNDHTAYIHDANSYVAHDLVIPWTIWQNDTAYTINLAKSKFTPNGDITGKLTIPYNVVEIGNDAFAHCSGLNSVILPPTLKTIGDFTFSSCTNLTTIIIPDSVTNIGIGCFNNCTNLSIIGIGTGLQSIASLMFYDCANLSIFFIPTNITSIGSQAFFGCTGLSVLVISENVTVVGKEAFKGWSTNQTIMVWWESSDTPADWNEDWNSSEATIIYSS